MTYIGKMLGGLLGAVSGRWWLAALGVILGHQFDRGYARQRRTTLRIDAPTRDLIFTLLGAVAKADGQVRQSEIDAARLLMQRLGLSASDTQAAIVAFRHGKQPGLDLATAIATYRDREHPDDATRRGLLRVVVAAVLEGGAMSKPVRAQLWTIAQAFGIGRVELVQLEALLRAEQGIGEAREQRATDAELTDAYAQLELDQHASNGDVKKAYRRLMNRHHPDKLTGANASEAELEAAEARSREIISAYEKIRRRRGIR
ncbi:MAG: co-chaperone DjlA [Pseudomonadota bacterium]